MNPAIDLEVLNGASPTAFAAAVGPLFESAPRFLTRLAAERPFDDWEGLFVVGRAIAHVMPEAEQVELVDAHPRLGAAPDSVSALSFREQGYDRPNGGAGGGERVADAAAGSVAAELGQLNAAYEARFGFRYCVFVAGRSRAALLPGLRTALHADRAAELRRAIDAVVDIAVARRAALEGGAG